MGAIGIAIGLPIGIAIGIAGGSPVTLRVGILMVTLLCIGKNPIS
jgi:hypothetical protein